MRTFRPASQIVLGGLLLGLFTCAALLSGCAGGDGGSTSQSPSAAPQPAGQPAATQPAGEAPAPAPAPAPGGDTIRLGVAGPFTGSGSVYGEMIWFAAQVALVEINKEQGGIEWNGKRHLLEFAKGDDQSKNDQAQIVANKFAADPQICLVVGHFNSSCSLAGKPIYMAAGLVEFSPASTNVEVCQGSPYTFRNLYRDDYQGEFLAQFALETLGAKRVGVFYDNDDYGIGLKNAFVKRAGQIGLEIYGEEAYTRDLTLDFSSGVDKFGSANLDAIFIAGLYEAAAIIVKSARERGIMVPVLAGDGVDSPGLIQGAGDAAEGVIVTSPFVFTDDNPAATAFALKFNDINGKMPDTWAALTYDAIMMAVDGVRAVGPDREKLRDWLAGHDSMEKGWKGITGVTYFDENGDCLKPAYAKIVKDGDFVPYSK
jgi:branched-chain amino acid transport system substrate-binding protein